MPENPALHYYENLRFYPADDDNILFYGKMTPDSATPFSWPSNLDPFQTARVGRARARARARHRPGPAVPGARVDRGPQSTYGRVRSRTSASIRPAEPAAIYAVTRWGYKDYDDPCY